MLRLIALFAVLLAFGLSEARAVQPDEVMADPAKEARAREISTELRCMVCQNQSIDDSDAPLAKDLRILVRERINKGDSDAEVKDFLVDRYGEFVLLRPRFGRHTWLLWLITPLLLAAGAFGVVAWFRSRPRAGAEQVLPLTPHEEARLAALMAGDDGTKPERSA
ncbi:MAG: cytochrome c-type biogenesis protein CcmH [Alphaproteobacteria bacterium]|nr:cytochrome c-type biogenesis protein CcmH [Alphaproteobacteria bacterium]